MSNELISYIVNARKSAINRLDAICRETMAIVRAERESQNHTAALRAIARVEKQLEIKARLLGQLSDSAKIPGILDNPPPSVDYSKLSDESYSNLKGWSRRPPFNRRVVNQFE